ncbi:tyrosine-type recombinase/integrase [Psychromonas sp. KJ10-10]|uniref:tyrosine-type recombinase/integrase n=1 Tax=Psychromonas sp. KJ10-10 TaxID=3391823 RepID=UPI0039B6D959
MWNSLELHVFPQLGKIPIHTLTAPKVISVLTPLAKKGTLETVNRLCQRINTIMVYVANAGLIEHNPLTGIKSAFKNPVKRHMPTIKPQELPELMHALNTASIKIITRCLIEFELHTMCRPNEVTWCQMEGDR